MEANKDNNIFRCNYMDFEYVWDISDIKKETIIISLLG